MKIAKGKWLWQRINRVSLRNSELCWSYKVKFLHVEPTAKFTPFFSSPWISPPHRPLPHRSPLCELTSTSHSEPAAEAAWDVVTPEVTRICTSLFSETWGFSSWVTGTLEMESGHNYHILECRKTNVDIRIIVAGKVFDFKTHKDTNTRWTWYEYPT